MTQYPLNKLSSISDIFYDDISRDFGLGSGPGAGCRAAAAAALDNEADANAVRR